MSMRSLLNTAVYGAKRSAIREYSRLAAETPGCVALTLGEPDFDTPQPVEQAVADTVVDVVGSLCENNDKFAVNRALPKIDMGDILVISDAGAHGHSMGYNYNGKLRCAEFLLRSDGSLTMLRRAETPADYFAVLDVDSAFTGAEGLL